MDFHKFHCLTLQKKTDIMQTLTQTMEFARASVVCVFLSYNKKTLQKLVWKFLWRFWLCANICFAAD